MYGVCKVCGCTDTNACVGGCYWVDAGHTLCSRCAHVSERVISKKRFEKETPGQHKHPRGEKTCSLCAKTFEGYDIFCPHCGKLLQATKSVGMESYSMQEATGSVLTARPLSKSSTIPIAILWKPQARSSTRKKRR